MAGKNSYGGSSGSGHAATAATTTADAALYGDRHQRTDEEDVSEILRRADESSREAQALLGEIRKSRIPGFRQPQQMVVDYARNKHAGISPLAKFDNPFPSFGLFLRAVRQAACTGGWQSHDQLKSYVERMRTVTASSPLLKALPAGMNETVGADGGILVAPEYLNTILMRVYDNDLLGRTTLLPLTGGGSQLKIPAINESSRADGSRFGGIQAYWRGEADQVTKTKPSIKSVELELNDLMLLMRLTNNLMDDANLVAVEALANTIVSQEFAFKLGDGIVNGDGVEKIQGLLYSPSKVSQAAEAGQPAATVVANNILNMWSRLHPSCHANAIWLIDQSVVPHLGRMTIGTAGANMVVYQPPGGLSASPYATLMGKPVIPTEFNAAVGTEGDIILGDLSTMLTITKGGLQSASSMHVYFDTHETAYKFVYRVDTRSWWMSALTPKNGGATQSNIVTLATR